MPNRATGAQVFLPLGFLRIDAQLGELLAHVFFADDSGAELLGEVRHVERGQIDRGLSVELRLEFSVPGKLAREKRRVRGRSARIP